MAEKMNWMKIIPAALIWAVLLTVYLMALSATMAGALPQLFVAISATLAVPFIVTIAFGIVVIKFVRGYLPSQLYELTRL